MTRQQFKAYRHLNLEMATCRISFHNVGRKDNFNDFKRDISSFEYLKKTKTACIFPYILLEKLQCIVSKEKTHYVATL